MKIVYFTTAIREQDYKEFQKHWNITLNPSNQNFHNKMIRSLAKTNKVHVISIRPFSLRHCNLKKLNKDTIFDGNITWHYIKRPRNKLSRILNIKNEAIKTVKEFKHEDSIIVTDTINTSVFLSATKCGKHFKLPVIGVCTDSPSNISGTSKSYTQFLLKQSESLSGVIALTEELNKLYNPEQKPRVILEGIVENNSTKGTIDENRYFFFGGAMLPKYGIYSLIEAYKKLDPKDVQLLLCGHHYDKEMLMDAIGGDPRIKFLGILPVEEVRELEKHALACVNPRPFSEDLDRFSIPSKTIEYIASGAVTISVKNTKLMRVFPNEVIWAKSSEVDDLKLAMQKVLELSEVELKNLAQSAQDKSVSLYSIDATNKRLDSFLRQFVE